MGSASAWVTGDGAAPRVWRLSPLQTGLLLVDLNADPDSAAVRLDLFGQAHGLTGAERAVLALLADGADVATIAARRGASRETVRVQMRALRDKTGCSTQLGLMAALAECARPHE